MCWRHRNSEELNTAKLAAKVPSTTDTVVTEFYSESADEGICATANPVRLTAQAGEAERLADNIVAIEGEQ